MGSSSLRLPITAIQVGTVAMLMRSVALDRWITVAACLILLAASAAAARDRTWGVAVAFVLGITFVGLCALGVAPLMFAVLGFLAIRPFARMFGHFLRFDRSAAIVLASGAGALGAAGALAWKGYAHALFSAIPLLTPSEDLHHGVVVALIGAVASFAGLVGGRRSSVSTEGARIRIAANSEGEASSVAAAEDADAELDAEVEHEPLTARRG